MVQNLIVLGTQLDPSKVEAASFVSEISIALNIFIEFDCQRISKPNPNKINWELLKSPKFPEDIERFQSLFFIPDLTTSDRGTRSMLMANL